MDRQADGWMVYIYRVSTISLRYWRLWPRQPFAFLFLFSFSFLSEASKLNYYCSRPPRHNRCSRYWPQQLLSGSWKWSGPPIPWQAPMWMEQFTVLFHIVRLLGWQSTKIIWKFRGFMYITASAISVRATRRPRDFPCISRILCCHGSAMYEQKHRRFLIG